MGDGGMNDQNENQARQKPKREFLKRKKPAYVPPKDAPSKQYKYYSENFQQVEKRKSQAMDSGVDSSERTNENAMRRPPFQRSQNLETNNNADRRRVKTPHFTGQT